MFTHSEEFSHNRKFPFKVKWQNMKEAYISVTEKWALHTLSKPTHLSEERQKRCMGDWWCEEATKGRFLFPARCWIYNSCFIKLCLSEFTRIQTHTHISEFTHTHAYQSLHTHTCLSEFTHTNTHTLYHLLHASHCFSWQELPCVVSKR